MKTTHSGTAFWSQMTRLMSGIICSAACRRCPQKPCARPPADLQSSPRCDMYLFVDAYQNTP